jgi:hypothetical protein
MLQRMRWMIPLAVLACQTEPVLADVLTDWNEKTVAFVTPRMVPAAGQRVVATVQIAMFDAINSVERRYRPYLVQLPATTTSREAAAAAAAATVLAGLHPQAEAELKAAGAAYLASLPDGDGKTEGIKLGEAIAAKILATRAKDGADAPDSYRPRTVPGVYVPTPITVSSTSPNVAKSGPRTTMRSKSSAARPAPSDPLDRPRMRASGSLPARRAPNPSCVRSWRRKSCL